MIRFFQAIIRAVQSKYFCSIKHILLNKKCYSFQWIDTKFNTIYNPNCNLSVNETIFVFHHIYNAVILTNIFPLVLVKHKVLVQFYRNEHSLQYFYPNITHKEGYNTCIEKENQLVHGSNLYYCTGGGYISYMYFCDGNKDCPNSNSDETICILYLYYIYDSNLYINRTFENYKCSNLHKKSKEGVCEKYADIAEENTHLNVIGDEKISNSKIEYDFYLKQLYQNEQYEYCSKSSQLPCVEGHPLCYNIYDICVYRKCTNQNHICSCPNGAHLENCKLFECGTMFKCPNAYCIPWPYLCDGTWDCPKGYDEIYYPICGSNHICQHMYRCRNTMHVCLPLGLVCNGFVDCPIGDDEILCNIHHITCPLKCVCLLFAIECNDISLNEIILNIGKIYISISVSSSRILSWESIERNFVETHIVRLPFNSFKDVCSLSKMTKLLFLDLSYNSIEKVKERCLSAAPSLIVLLINNNNIKKLGLHSLIDLAALRILNISRNPITNLPFTVLTNSFQMKVFLIQEVNLLNIDFNCFKDSNLKMILSSHYQVCCIAPNTAFCSSPRPWYVSCKYLLPNVRLTILFMICSSVILTVNITSILLSLTFSDLGKSFVLLAVCLNVNNILLAVYFGIIWISHVIIKELFIVQQNIWKSSDICFLAYSSALLHTILCTIFLLIIPLAQ